MLTTRRRIATGVLAAAVTLVPAAAHALIVEGGTSTVYGPAASAAAATTEDPAEAGASFLAGQLAATGYLTSSGYTDYGLTIDAIFALDAAGVAQDQAAASTQYIAENIRTYLSFDDPNELYAGASGKALLLATVQGVDPTAFGGVNLIETVQSTETAEGRYSDQSQYGDYSNSFGQSFAILGLERSGTGASDISVAFLKNQQCADGGFRVTMNPADGACVSDTDATALAIQALALASPDDAAIANAVSYLQSTQQADGGWPGGSGAEAINTNTTGLAASSLKVAGAPNTAALDFILGLQAPCDEAAPIAGAVAYDAETFGAMTAGDAPDDKDRRATTQAVLGLSGESFLTLSADGSVAGAPVFKCAATTAPSSSSDVPSTSSAAPTTSTEPSTSASASSTAAPTTAPSTTAPDTQPTTTAAAAPVAGDDDSAGPQNQSPQALPAVKASGSESLAATGVDAGPAALLALGLMGAGGLALAAARRTKAGS